MPKRQRREMQGSVTQKGHSSVSSSLSGDLITDCADGGHLEAPNPLAWSAQHPDFTSKSLTDQP